MYNHHNAHNEVKKRMINKVNIKSQQEVKKQFYHHFFKQINIQHIFFFLAFIIYGIGDGVTGAILMNTKGIYAESNLFFRFLYETFGLMAFIAIKVLLTCILLLVAFIIYKLSNGHNYWMINGWLAALSIGGIMAVHANLRAVIGLPYPNPNSIIFLYIILTFILVETGVYVDRKHNIKTHCKGLCVYRPCKLSHLCTRMHLYLIKISSKPRLKLGTL